VIKSCFKMLFFGSCILILLFTFSSCLVTQELTTVSFFSQGDYIQGWYWLRDPSFNNHAEWVFTSLPQGNRDFICKFEVLATDTYNGKPGVDAEFFLSYGIPPMGNMGGLFLGRLKIKLKNVHDPNDTTSYLCRGTVVIPRKGLENSQALWLMAKRSDDLNVYPPFFNHIAFRKESVQVFTYKEKNEVEREINHDQIR
jgi:hypothetical protein